MNLTADRRLFFCRAVGALFLLIPAWAISLNAQTPRFDELRDRFEGGEVFEAAFTHNYQDSYTGEETRTEGRIWIGRGHYRVEGENQIMVVDGEISRVYDGNRNRLLISDYDEEEDDFAPSRMLQGVDDTYRVGESADTGGTRVELRSEDLFALFSHVVIMLDGEGLPKRIEAVDQADNLLVTHFEEGRFGPSGPELFDIRIPDDAERVDLRH